MLQASGKSLTRQNRNDNLNVHHKHRILQSVYWKIVVAEDGGGNNINNNNNAVDQDAF